MNNQLVPVEQKLVNFNGAEIMAVKASNDKLYVGVRWVCRGIGLSEDQATRQTKKINEDVVLVKGSSKMTIPTTGGNQEILTIELNFLPLWLAKINANIIESEEVQERLVEYQLKAKDVLAEAFLQKAKSLRRRMPTWDREAMAEIRFAKEFAKAIGIRPERAVAVAIARTEKETGRQLNDYRKLLPAVSEEDAEILTASQIGEQLDLKSSAVNLLLEEMGLQYGIREAGKKPGTERLVKRNPWKLTEAGKEYGMMQDAANNKWEGFQILWKPKVLDVVRGFISSKSDADQEAHHEVKN